ncbi:hypothetical protein E2C01_078426 [Portunus trituberculatus]|uniref:Uncharacterized protein n=1 Tax=Portunus trituberculatus TaxID=210409 RepID=A0A5B7IE98_PORTR|nr:hypothetical protein [Portunus trituberculatus]
MGPWLSTGRGAPSSRPGHADTSHVTPAGSAGLTKLGRQSA